MWVSLPWVLHSSMVRASDRCTEGQPTGAQKVIGSILVRDSDFFFVPCLWHVDHIVSHFFTELKSTINLYLSHTWQFWHFYRSSMHYTCHTWTLAHHESFVAQCLEHLTGIQVIVGSIPVGDSDFFFAPCSWHVDDIISKKMGCFLVDKLSFLWN